MAAASTPSGHSPSLACCPSLSLVRYIMGLAKAFPLELDRENSTSTLIVFFRLGPMPITFVEQNLKFVHFLRRRQYFRQHTSYRSFIGCYASCGKSGWIGSLENINGSV